MQRFVTSYEIQIDIPEKLIRFTRPSTGFAVQWLQRVDYGIVCMVDVWHVIKIENLHAGVANLSSSCC